MGRCGLDCFGSEEKSVAGCLEHSNETKSVVKCGEFLD